MNTKLIRSNIEGALESGADAGEISSEDGLWALNTLEDTLTEVENLAAWVKELRKKYHE